MIVFEGKFYHMGVIDEISVGVEDGKIVKIGKNLTGERKVTINDGTIFPAMIDMHVHFRDPGYTNKEDFETGSLSALHGGVSFVVDMPNTNPVTDTYENLLNKIKIGEMKSYVDFGIAFLLHKKIDKEIQEKATMFKIYMAETTGIKPVNYLLIPEIIKDIEKNITIHAESQKCIENGKRVERNLMDHDMARPESCEVEALDFLADSVDKRVHIAHISSLDSADIAFAKGFTKEVTPHHLFLNREMDLGAFGKVNPPLRGKHVSENLLSYLKEGKIEVIASDHSPHTYEEKMDFEHAPSGLPGVETSLPLLFQAYRDGYLDLNTIFKTTMENPGKIVGIKKGRIDVGYDADFVVIKLSDSRKIRARDLHYKCSWTPFENFYGIFPRKMFIRGEKVLEDFEETVEPGFGKYY